MKDEIQTENDQSVERIDPLTGVGNLLALLETFTWRLAASEWTDFSLLLVDLNHFNQFNLERGHAQRGDGDAAPADVAETAAAEAPPPATP